MLRYFSSFYTYREISQILQIPEGTVKSRLFFFLIPCYFDFMPLKETWINPKIEIKETPNKGKGVFATKTIKTGETVLVWGGEYTNKKGVEKAKEKGKLVLQWDDNLFSVENAGEDLGYYINHACDSNTWMKDAYTLVARRDIAAGEEVTADYALWEADPNYISKWECQCGLPVCRKRITGND